MSIHDDLTEIYNQLLEVSSDVERLRHVQVLLRLKMYPEAAGVLGYIKGNLEFADKQKKE